MKHLALCITLLLALAAATCFLSYRLSGDSAVEEALAQGDALRWLKVEFQLSDEQFAKIKELHDSYSTECEKHCSDIREASLLLEQEEAKPNNADAIRAAKALVRSKKDICENAIEGHVRRCAAIMNPEAGARYLALVLPKIPSYDHKAAPDVQLNHHKSP